MKTERYNITTNNWEEVGVGVHPTFHTGLIRIKENNNYKYYKGEGRNKDGSLPNSLSPLTEFEALVIIKKILKINILDKKLKSKEK